MPSEKQADIIQPCLGEIEEAKRFPNGWVYRIAGQFKSSDAIPREAIVGAWKVDSQGNITGSFIPNHNYDPERWPSSSE